MSDRDRLLALLEVHESAVADFVELVRSLDDSDDTRPTDLPGWTVHDVVAHVAHLEAVLAGAPEETVEVGDASHAVGLNGVYTEQGVVARRDRSREELLTEIEDGVRHRHAAVRADPPDDGSAIPPITPGDIGWSWATLLSNRPLDVLVHEQDLRRALGRPDHIDTVAARHVVDVFGLGLGFVLVKRAGAAAGTTLAVELTDTGRRIVAGVGENGRGGPVATDAPATTTLRMDTATYLALSAGRGDPASYAVAIDGDEELARRALAGMTLTP